MNNQTLTYTPVRVIAVACLLTWAGLAATMLLDLAQKGFEDFYGSEMVFATLVGGSLAAAGALGVLLKKRVGAALVIIGAVISHVAGVFSDGTRGDYNWGLTLLSGVLVVVVFVHSFLADQNHA